MKTLETLPNLFKVSAKDIPQVVSLAVVLTTKCRLKIEDLAFIARAGVTCNVDAFDLIQLFDLQPVNPIKSKERK